MLANLVSALAIAAAGYLLVAKTELLAKGERPDLEQSYHDDNGMFVNKVVDSNGPRDPWGKSVGDLNGDGLPDLVVGGNGSRQLVWYSNPDWTRATIAEGESYSTDHEIADVDRDGRNDIVSISEERLTWYRNPDWTPTVIASKEFHDIEVADFDRDGDIDVVARNQSAFGGSGATVFLYMQDAPNRWIESTLTAPDGEGLKVADINNDGYVDIVVNSVWFENKGARRNADWLKHTYSNTWTWPHTYIDTGDIDGDGRIDIVMAPSEPRGARYKLSWFQAPSDPGEIWKEHTIERSIETIVHFVGLRDMDGDGDLDAVSAEMHQGTDPDYVLVHLNGGKGKHWTPLVIATTGSHNIRLADIDQDGDVDIFGANWSGNRQNPELWINQTCPLTQAWRRHVLDDARPWTAVFVLTSDLDKDGLVDIASGAWWFRNTGLIQRPWVRRRIGPEVGQVAAIADTDNDGLPDILATKVEEGVDGGDILWVRNLGGGKFAEPLLVAKTDGDFLQGVATGSFTDPSTVQFALSWHAAGKGVQLLTPPRNNSGRWSLETISTISQDEALSAGDIDRDGDLDILLGTKWLENTGAAWTPHELTTETAPPDRNRLVDINGDGRLDAVVGFEAINEEGDLVWYEQLGKSDGDWRRWQIATLVGPMSLDVADWDNDGDLDIFVGEHNLERPESAGIYLFLNAGGNGQKWQQVLIHLGDEHHNGALSVDLDNDGDLDVVSIGWGHDRMIAYENRENSCKRPR